MTKRNKGLTSQQTLVWDDENRLSQVQDSNGATLEQYRYGGDARQEDARQYDDLLLLRPI